MVQAGANGINWIGLVTEWTPDFTTAEREAAYPGILAHDGMVALSIEYIGANAQAPASRG
jgi:hypothetical protein